MKNATADRGPYETVIGLPSSVKKGNEMFDLEQAIKNWKRKLRRNPAFEDGDIAELESHLREEIGRLKAEGLSEEAAFQQASEEIGEPKPIGDELGKVRKRKNHTTTGFGLLNLGLLNSYMNVSLRGLKRNKGFSIINILGLSVGIWACLAIYLVIQDDLSYDRFHKNADRVYRVENVMYLPDEGEYMHRSRVPITWAGALKAEIPEIRESGRIAASRDERLVRLGGLDRSFYENEFIYADNAIFEIFSFSFLSGDERKPLERPNTVVLSESFAEKYFGDKNPIGRTLIVEVGWYGPVEHEVTAVVEDLPQNSHFRQGIILSFPTLENQLFVDINQNWNIHFYYTYLLMEAQADPEAFAAKLDQFVGRHYDEERAARYDPGLIALTDIYLHAEGEAQLGATGSTQYIYIQAVIALFILLIAVFNFVNLSTAQSIDRAKEVGVRKVLGADRSSLIRQYLSESVVYCIVATLIAVGLLYATLPSLNMLSGKLLVLTGEKLVELLPKLLIGILVVGIVAGLYPAFFLSSFRPSAIFKGWSTSGDRTGRVRKILVGLQFAVSVFLIIATLVVYQQLQFLKERDIGFDKDQVVEIDLMAREVAENYTVLKNRLLQVAPVSEVSVSTHSMVPELYYNSYRFEDTPSGPFERTMARYQIDRDFFSTMGIPLLAGELTASFDSDSSGYVVINEAVLQEAGWENPEEAIGTRVNYTRANGGAVSASIAAVSANFHLESPHKQVEPMVMEYWNEAFSVLHVRISGFEPAHLEQIEQAYKEIYPTLPFEFTFWDDHLNRIYAREDKIGTLFYWFTVLAIVIACMGLFGVAAYAADRRTKEIGIRKVLGADALQIVTLLSKDFLGLVTVSFLIASPLAWFAMRQWLNNYTYRIEMGIGLFLVSGLLIVLIALLSISWQSVRAALMNPIKNLRTE